MFKKRLKFSAQAVLLILFFFLPRILTAEQSSGIGSQSVHLDFAVNVPQILFLRVGSPGATIDTVRFDPTIIPTGAWINATSGGMQPIQIAGIVPSSTTVRLTADSSVPMSNGFFTIPFTSVRASGTGDFSSVSNLAFTGATDQIIWSSTGPGLRQGTFTYQYLNAAPHPTGYYSGSVTYTLAVP